MSNLLSSFRHQAAVIEMGIQALLALVDCDDDECSYHVALSLRKLSPNLKSHPVIIYAGGFQVLFRLIEHSNFNTIKQAAAALRDLCANPDYKVRGYSLSQQQKTLSLTHSHPPIHPLTYTSPLASPSRPLHPLSPSTLSHPIPPHPPLPLSSPSSPSTPL